MFKEVGSVQVLTGVAGAAVTFLRVLDKGRSRMAGQAGLSGSEVRVLSFIAEVRQVTPKMMAGFTDLSLSALTALTDRLVDRDIVRRATNPQDRRSLFLELTPSGHVLMDAMYDDFRSLVDQGLESVSDTDQELLGRALLVLASALDDQIEAASVTTNEVES